MTAMKLQTAFADHVGMSTLRLRLLMLLRWQGESSHSDLRQALGTDTASITRLVKQFEADGLLVRRMDPDNNRYTLTALAPAGELFADELDRAQQDYQRRLLYGIGIEQQQSILDVFRRVHVNIVVAKEQP
ncbi:MarR family winged helix-turn-helix transcriptional regulator [Nocardia sp. NBC_01327]|uniref:MarR family winged helix-turn-helix transcriptional regulator n=1 Tax=Nocardia sp. NBC_01327 TaxID=2903593 RepID=UPI002E1454FA|nr:MarR family winged helix-turn-helix transcriptional regulator [Nocardia sp. NBC_01327]